MAQILRSSVEESWHQGEMSMDDPVTRRILRGWREEDSETFHDLLHLEDSAGYEMDIWVDQRGPLVCIEVNNEVRGATIDLQVDQVDKLIDALQRARLLCTAPRD